jgi:hypothetical protein
MRMLSQPFKLNHLDDVANSYDSRWHWWVTVGTGFLAEIWPKWGPFSVSFDLGPIERWLILMLGHANRLLGYPSEFEHIWTIIGPIGSWWTFLKTSSCGQCCTEFQLSRSHSLSASVPVCDGCANAGTSSRHRVASPLRFGWLISICLSSTCDFDMYPRPSKGQVKPGLESKDQVKLGWGSAGYLQHQKLMLDHMASWKSGWIITRLHHDITTVHKPGTCFPSQKELILLATGR